MTTNIIHTARWGIAHHGNIYAESYRNHKRENASGYIGANPKSEGQSFYFLDPDGHKLELHVGDLASRLVQCREKLYFGMRFGPGK